ncbi:MAG TPA: MFS transporter [Methanocella sp.]|nr:MFS transporter [Methanocella sp.]
MEEIHSRQREVATGATPYKNRYAILAIILTGILMSVMDGNVVGIALPTITSTFHIDLALSQWAATAYLLTMTSTLLVFGKLSEYTGKSKLYVVGFAIFTIGSITCGFAPGIYELIGFRVLQAIGGAMVGGIGAAIIFQVFPPAERGRAMGYIGAVSGIGCIVGPGLGGFLVEHFGWGSVFLINAPIGIAVILAALKYLKVEEARAGSFNLDLIGAVALIVSASSLMLMLNEIGLGLHVTTPMIVYAALFLSGLVVFLIQESRFRAPLLDLSIFGEAKFTLPLASMLIAFLTCLLLGVVAPFYFEGALGYTPSAVGLLMFVPPVIMVVGSPLGGWLVDRRPWRYYSAAGMAIMAVSFGLMGFFASRLDVTMTLASLVLYGIGEALFTSPNSTETMGALPRQKTGIASSAAAMVRNLGMGLGVSLGAVILSLQLPGGIFTAAPAAIANASGIALYVAGGLCTIGALASWLRHANNWTQGNAANTGSVR